MGSVALLPICDSCVEECDARNAGQSVEAGHQNPIATEDKNHVFLRYYLQSHIWEALHLHWIKSNFTYEETIAVNRISTLDWSCSK